MREDKVNIKPELLEDLGMKFPRGDTNARKRRYGLYKCPQCGNTFEARVDNIVQGTTKGCGCLRGELHNLSYHRIYSTWNSMMARCYNMNKDNYINYGSKGIIVCERWHNVTNFIEDMFPSFEEGLTLDRIDVTGNYEIENCRWVDRSTQAQNTRKLKSTNKSGYRGVSWDKGTGKWRVQIQISNKNKHLGRFTNPEEGARAYDQYIIDNNLSHTKNFEY